LINNTVESPACEEALKYPPPSLPFPYMANPIMNKIKRQILGAICECSCKQDVQGGYHNPDDPVLSVKVHPSDTGALDGILLFFIFVTAAMIFLFRKRFGIFKALSGIFHKNATRASPYIFRTPIQVNEKRTQSSGLLTSSTPSRRRGIAPKEQRRQTFWEAAASGNMNIIQRDLSSGMFTELNKVHPRYGTPLCAACEGGDLRIATILLIRGADVNTTGGRFFVPIQAAAYAGNTTLVQFLLAKGASVNIHGGWSETPLQAACERGDVEMVRSILDAGANVNLGGGSLGYPLQAAASRGSVDIVSLLITRGAEINAEGGEYGCALNAAVACGSSELIDLLLSRGAKVDLTPGDYGNCVQIALRQGFPELAKSLIEKGANGDVADEQNRTPLIEAAILGDDVLVTRLLNGGVDVNAQGEFGMQYL
jgi:ankyrin repeat protein